MRRPASVMARRPALAAATLLLLLLVALPLSACAGTRAVTVTGWGALERGEVAEARARAVTDALGRAVQAAGRTAVTAETRLVNDWDLSSSVAAQTLGVIRGYRIIDEGVDPGRGYRVKLVAQVAGSASQAGTTGDTSKKTRVLVIAREQYRGSHTPPQILATELARKLQDKGFVAVLGEWRSPVVTLSRGELKVSAERLREVAGKHEADHVLVAWAEARHSDTANPTLHSSRALGKVQLYAGATADLVGTKAAAEVLGWGPTPERAGNAALAELRKGLVQQGLLFVAAAATTR